jgi:hypothetical protein
MSEHTLQACNFLGNTDCTQEGRAFGIMDTKGNCVTLGMPQVNLVHALTAYVSGGPNCVNPTVQCSTDPQDFLSVGIILTDPSPFTAGPYFASTYTTNNPCVLRAGEAPPPCIMKNAGGTELALPCLYKSPQCSYDDFAEDGEGALGGQGTSGGNQNISSLLATTTTKKEGGVWLIILLVLVGIIVVVGVYMYSKRSGAIRP